MNRIQQFLIPAFILALACLVNFTFSQQSFYPLHDGMTVFGIFHYFYSNFYFHHQLAQWTPFDYYGQPTYFAQIAALSPMSVVIMIVGKCLAITDVLILFKWIMIGETFIFGAGLWQLGTIIYRRQSTVALIVTAGVLSTYWLTQPFFNFRLFYLVPWMLVLVLRYIHRRDIKYGYLLIVMMLLSCLGSLVYFIGIWFWLMIAAALIFIIAQSIGFKEIRIKFFKHTATAYGVAIMAIIMTGIFYFFLKGLTHGVDLVAPERGGNAQSQLAQFISYGGQGNFINWLKALWGDPIFLGGLYDLTVYAGLWLVPCLLVAIVWCHSRMAISFYVLTLLIALLIFMPVVSKIIFWLPMMAYFRHIGHLLPLLKLMMIISAGFGLELIIERYGGKIKYGWWFVLFLFICDLMIFQYRAYATLASRQDIIEAPAHVFDAKPLVFQDMRTRIPITTRQQQALTIIQSSTISGGRYTTDYNFIQWDACNSPWRKDWIASGVRKITDIKHSMVEVVGGCESSKLWLAPNAQTINTTDNLVMFQRITQVVDQTIGHDPTQAMGILGAVREQFKQGIFVNNDVDPQQLGAVSKQGEIEVKSFTANKLEAYVKIDDAKGQWLYYADSYHPGWQARIDHQPAALSQANVGFKAVHVPQGNHEVSFEFKDGRQSILSLLLFIIAGIGGCWLFMLVIFGL